VFGVGVVFDGVARGLAGVVDLFHFLVSLAQTLGMTAEDIYQGYVKKNEVNHKRQESGYTVKDHADSKHI